MLLSREEMTFDFGEARFDLTADKATLRWIFSQFLYGEVTGIQVGHWLYAAPDLAAARFLAKQAIEEMQHVGNFLRILHLLELEPEPAHPIVRFLATGMMGDDWAEHVTTEMALGEGFVLMAMFAMAQTVEHDEIRTILERAARQESSHIAFGEAQTAALAQRTPGDRERLLGLSLVWMWGVRRLSRYMEKKLPQHHPVLRQLPAFLTHALACTERRVVRMGLSEVEPTRLSRATQARLIALAYGRKAALDNPIMRSFRGKPRRLTDTYLQDASTRAILTGQAR